MVKSCIAFVLLVMSLCTDVLAQSALKKGHLQFNGGTDQIFAYNYSADYAFHNDLTLGFEFISRKSKVVISLFEVADVQQFVVRGKVLNLNYHMNTIWDMTDNWDIYIGPNYGYYEVVKGYDMWTFPHSKLGGQLGMRYFVFRSLGLNVELGLVDALRIKGGLSLRL